MLFSCNREFSSCSVLFSVTETVAVTEELTTPAECHKAMGVEGIRRIESGLTFSAPSSSPGSSPEFASSTYTDENGFPKAWETNMPGEQYLEVC